MSRQQFSNQNKPPVSLRNLRVLCRRCHTLRADPRHRKLIAPALRDQLIPPDWRRFVWDDDQWPDEAAIKALRRWAEAV